MATRLRRVITAIDATGKPFSEIHRETEVNGKWYPDDPVPLSQAGADADEWKAAFNAAVQAENDQLKADIVALNADHAAAVAELQSTITAANGETQVAKSERDAALRDVAELTSRVEPLETQVATIPALHEQIATLTADLATRTAERDAALAQIPPAPGPREVTPQAFLLRVMSVAPHAIGKIWSSESEIAGVVAATLFTWPGLIDLDSPRLKELLGGLEQSGLMTQEEIAKVLE